MYHNFPYTHVASLRLPNSNTGLLVGSSSLAIWQYASPLIKGAYWDQLWRNSDFSMVPEKIFWLAHFEFTIPNSLLLLAGTIKKKCATFWCLLSPFPIRTFVFDLWGLNCLRLRFHKTQEHIPKFDL